MANFQFPINFKLSNFKFRNSITDWRLETGEWKLQQGQSLFEVVVALMVVSMIIVALVNLAAVSIRNTDFSRSKSRADRYTQEADEWIRGERDAGWPVFAARAITPTWCIPAVSWSGAKAGACGSSDFISGSLFRREIDFTIIDASNIQVAIKVYWDDAKGRHETRSVTNLTNWNAN